MLKDEKLFSIYQSNNNVAKFISYDERGSVRYETHKKPEFPVNVRSFTEHLKSGRFKMNVNDQDTLDKVLNDNIKDGYYSIVNESIDINDGGVSGVLLGDIIEFSPKDTPRCVEKPGVCRLPAELGLILLELIYFPLDELRKFKKTERVEFSIHPLPQGVFNTHVIIWEVEDVGYSPEFTGTMSHPNNFSRFIGDKAYGILIAHLLHNEDYSVPSTNVIGRNVNPFLFGDNTQTYITWMRTAPAEPIPGKLITTRGWSDPFKACTDDVVSVLAQESVNAGFSGAYLTDDLGRIIIDGTAGYGDEYMLGQTKCDLPDFVLTKVKQVAHHLNSILGFTKCEWVLDEDHRLWIVQLHTKSVKSVVSPSTIYPGNPTDWIKYDIREGLEGLRDLLDSFPSKDFGIELSGSVGLTSHFCDVLRQAQVPSRINQGE